MTKFIQMVGRAFRRGPTRSDLLEALADEQAEAVRQQTQAERYRLDCEWLQKNMDRKRRRLLEAKSIIGRLIKTFGLNSTTRFDDDKMAVVDQARAFIKTITEADDQP